MSDVPGGALTRRWLLRNGLVASVVGSAVGTTALLGGAPARAATQSDASLLLPILGAEPGHHRLSDALEGLEHEAVVTHDMTHEAAFPAF